jgi:23S rRNA (pseudouridine1915-N3)-methyltransferase
MKISFRAIGKRNENYVNEGVQDFTKRISNYFPVEWIIIPVPKNAGLFSDKELRKREGELILQSLKDEDYLVALDENGKSFNSAGLSAFIGEKASQSIRNIVFIIGGAYGLHETVLQKAKLEWSLSSLTFPHQLVRLILAEQIYRACTILRNEKYHHP